VFLLGIEVSRIGLCHRDRLLYDAPPVAVILVGVVLTLTNLQLLR
jgi:hypothetical protein